MKHRCHTFQCACLPVGRDCGLRNSEMLKAPACAKASAGKQGSKLKFESRKMKGQSPRRKAQNSKRGSPPFQCGIRIGECQIQFTQTFDILTAICQNRLNYGQPDKLKINRSLRSKPSHLCCVEALKISSSFFFLLQPLSVLSLLRASVFEMGPLAVQRGRLPMLSHSVFQIGGDSHV